jgi:hypothetical protein
MHPIELSAAEGATRSLTPVSGGWIGDVSNTGSNNATVTTVILCASRIRNRGARHRLLPWGSAKVGAIYAVAATARRIVSTERRTSSSSVDQLLTEMRNTSWSCQRDPDIHVIPSAIRCAVTARVRVLSANATQTCV